MSIVSIVYYSGAGHTHKLAQAVQAGAASVEGTTANLISISGSDIINGRYQNTELILALEESDAIIFGSPTYMGGPAAQFKAFADATVGSWTNQKWRDKIAAGFTVSGTPSGDKFSTLQYFHTLAMEHGMIWIGLGEMPMQSNGINRLGSWGGAMGEANQESPDVAPSAQDKLTGEVLGRRVAAFALKNQPVNNF